MSAVGRLSKTCLAHPFPPKSRVSREGCTDAGSGRRRPAGPLVDALLRPRAIGNRVPLRPGMTHPPTATPWGRPPSSPRTGSESRPLPSGRSGVIGPGSSSRRGRLLLGPERQEQKGPAGRHVCPLAVPRGSRSGSDAATFSACDAGSGGLGDPRLFPLSPAAFSSGKNGANPEPLAQPHFWTFILGFRLPARHLRGLVPTEGGAHTLAGDPRSPTGPGPSGEPSCGRGPGVGNPERRGQGRLFR